MSSWITDRSLVTDSKVLIDFVPDNHRTLINKALSKHTIDLGAVESRQPIFVKGIQRTADLIFVI